MAIDKITTGIIADAAVTTIKIAESTGSSDGITTAKIAADAVTTIKIDNGTDNTGHSGATAVTNFEYEEKQQDELGKIRLLVPGHVTAFVEEYEKLMGESVI